MSATKGKKRGKKKTSKIYTMHRYQYYNIHKTTDISYNPVQSCVFIQNIFGKKNPIPETNCPRHLYRSAGCEMRKMFKGGQGRVPLSTPIPFKIRKDD